MDESMILTEQKDPEVIQDTINNLPESEQAGFESAAPSLSKRKQKKLLKMVGWHEKKMDMRAKEKEKYKAKRLDMKAKGIERKGPSRKALKRNKVEISKSPYHVAIDCSFDELMLDKDISSCVKQLLRVYTENRRSIAPMNVYFTGIKSNSKTLKTMSRHDGFKNWDVKFEEESFDQVFDKSRLVYLTSESDNVLTTMEEGQIYVIGGLVDHNSQKGLCFKIAKDLGINHARLPLSEHIEIKTRTVLTINHVFEILLGVSLGSTWPDIILKTLPQRKGCKPKSAKPDLSITQVPTENSNDKTVDEPMEDALVIEQMEQSKNFIPANVEQII